MIISMIEQGCSVGFFGLGDSNLALLNTLPLDKCKITLRSDNEIDLGAINCPHTPERIFTKSASCESIDEDILIFSPSVRRDRPPLTEALRQGVIFTSDAEIFFEKNESPVFAITGSDGKSTTATLASRILSAAGHNNALIGNVGKPMVSELGKADFYVAELSSFMLQYLKPRAMRGCITSISPNHLDWHKDFSEYKKTKISLAQGCDNFVITDELRDIQGAYGIVSSRLNYKELKPLYEAEIYITAEREYICKNGERLMPMLDVRRREEHNIKNLMMAIALTNGYADNDAVVQVAKSFGGLSHRCELVASYEGVDFFDSSIDSTPQRTTVTLQSLGREVVLVLGGRSKGLDYSILLPQLKKYANRVILTGENAKEIYYATGGYRATIISNFDDAVLVGAELAKDVGALLLSPASTSYDGFKNYAQRGDKFKNIINSMHKEN